MSTTTPPAPAPDAADARRAKSVQRAVDRAVHRLRALAKAHPAPAGGAVVLANMGARGVRIVFVADDGTYGDAVVPSTAAAERVCAEGGWQITGWDRDTSGRIAPSPQDRQRMAGTGR